jgi:hypothetical protein
MSKLTIAPTEKRQEQMGESGVTLRVVILCLLLAFFFGYVIPIIDVKLSNTYLGSSHLPPGAVAVLVILLLIVNPLLRFFSKRWTLSRNETLTVYISCLFSVLVPGHSGENFFVSNLIGSFYYATAENKWFSFLGPYLKPWFTPALTGHHTYNRALVEGWYLGAKDIPWGAWLAPLVVWGSLIFASYIMLACLSVMLRAQWAEHEALQFPLLRLPLDLTEGCEHSGLAPFFRNRAMWIGFAIAASIQLLNGLNFYFPDLPTVPMSLPTSSFFTEAPWNQIGMTPLVIFPIGVGIAYLLTSEMSFSLWFFYWFFKLEYILAYCLGFPPASLPTPIGATAAAGVKAFTSFQQVGAFFAYTFFICWIGRQHWKHIFLRAIGRGRATPAERREGLSYPVAFWGFIFCFLFVIGWSVMAGVSLEVAIALWVAYLVITTALTRVVVESGLLSVQQGWTPLGTFAQLGGSGAGTWLSAQSIVPAMFVQVAMMTDLRAFLMPSFLQSFKLAHDRKIQAKPLLALIFAVIIIAFTMSIYMNVRLGYQQGGLSLNGWFAVNGPQLSAKNAKELIAGAHDAGIINWIWMGVGAALTIGMMIARSHFLWFPFHPIGYFMALTGPIHQLWFSIFLGWLCKTLISRFGGTQTYRKTTPLFLGLALGDVMMMVFWLLIDGWFGRVGHVLAIP